MAAISEVVEKTVVGRITRAPELSHSSAGVPVCRFMVSTDRGPARNPVITLIYVQGDLQAAAGEDLAIRCARLLKGDQVQVFGEEGERRIGRPGSERTEKCTIAEDVKLKDRPGHE